eukprot:tig00021720_g23182.t1
MTPSASSAELAVGEREYISAEVERLARQGAAAFNAKDFAKAEAAWTKVIELMPNNTLAWRNRGDARLDRKDFAGALADYEEAIRLSPSSMPDLYVGRGLAYEGVDRFDKARDDYTTALQLREEAVDPVALVYRGNASGSLGDWAAAEADYIKAEEIFSGARYEDAATTCRANQALAVYEQGRREESIRLMKSVIRRDPGFADMRIALAAASWRDEDYAESIKQWDFSCDNIKVGCSKYRDMDWVRRIRRWPPSLANDLERFLAEKAGAK